MRKVHITYLLLSISLCCLGQTDIADNVKIEENYNAAFTELKGMLDGNVPLSFKRAVFLSENAYLDSKLDYEKFNSQILLYADLCYKIAKQGQLMYNESDLETVKKYWSVFRLMTDTVQFILDSKNYFETNPFRYDFDDFWGEKDWTKMFVTKLIETNKGNCHSLPFLYKILCEELGVQAYLAMAPSHTYIKLKTKKTGWFNTELTSGYFPIDAWIMASGYIHLNAVQNRVYMDTLSQKQSIAVCLTDLAKGYERKNPEDLEFIEKCLELALRHYPLYTNALVLKAETTKKKFERLMKKYSANYPAEVFRKPDAKALFDQMEQQYFHIYTIGYRPMPKEMYTDWLADLSREKEKYLNKEIISNLNGTKTK